MRGDGSYPGVRAPAAAKGAARWRIEVFYDGVAFGTLVRGFLCAREPEHNLLLGILGQLDAFRGPAGPPYLAALLDEGDVRAVALRTPPHNLVLSMGWGSDGVRVLIADLAARDAGLPGVLAPEDAAGAFAASWAARTGAAAVVSVRERIYALSAVHDVLRPAGRMRDATAADRGLCEAWMGAFVRTIGHGREESLERTVDRRFAAPGSGIVLWQDGAPVSLAGHGGRTPTGVRIGPVYTPPDHRRHDYATALVADLSRRLLDGDAERCFLFTDLANPTSNAIYRRIGYRPTLDVREYRFTSGTGGD